MPEHWIREQDGTSPPGPPTSFEACCRGTLFSKAHKPSAPESPRPTVARTGRWANCLEEIVAGPSFQLPDDSRTLPAPYTSKEIATPAEHFHLSHPTPRLLPLPSVARSLSSVKSGFRDIPSELRAKADAATQWYWDAASFNTDPGRDVVTGLLQCQVTRENQVRDSRVAFREIHERQGSKELGIERTSGLTGAEEATVLRRTHEVRTSTTEIDRRYRRLPTPFCISKAKGEQGKHGKHNTEGLRLTAAVANVGGFSHRPALWSQERPTIRERRPYQKPAKPRVIIDRPVLSPQERQTRQERRPYQRPAKPHVIIGRPVPVAGNELVVGGDDVAFSGTAEDEVQWRSNDSPKTPAPPEKRARKKPNVDGMPAAGTQHAQKAEGDRETAYGLFYDGLVELCAMFSQFDRVISDFKNSNSPREVLRQLEKLVKRVIMRLNDLCTFAVQHNLLMEDDDYTKKLREIADGLPPRQEQLSALGVDFWDVGRFSDAYWNKLYEESARALDTAKKDIGRDCLRNCRWHNPAKWLYESDNDVFQA